MAGGLVVRVSTYRATDSDTAFVLFAAACGSSDDAIDAVRVVVPQGWRIKGVVGPLSADTVARLGLADGEARQI